MAMSEGYIPTADVYGGDIDKGELAAALSAELDSIGSHIFILPELMVVAAGTWASELPNLRGGGYRNSGSLTVNDKLTMSCYLGAGTYKLSWLTTNSSASGITTVLVDGESGGVYDNYNGSAEYNEIKNETGIVIATDGIKEISFEVTGKNGSSSNYACYFGFAMLERTA